LARCLLGQVEMSPLLRRTIHGALGGAIGAACMTVARMLAHRGKLIDQMVPQAVETWAKHQLPVTLPALPSQRAVHHVADQMLHLGYGSSMGAVYGLALGRGPASAPKVLGFGLGVWVFGSFVLLPALKVMRPEWRAKPVEVAVNLGAHLLYAGALALLTEEFETQSFLQPLQYPASLVAKTG
jgi:hypothetical protein